MKQFKIIFFQFVLIASVALNSCNSTLSGDKVTLDLSARAPVKISQYSFFKEPTDFSKPNAGVISYKYVNVMFNDFSLRENFVYLPDGKSFTIDPTHLLNLPVGSCLINIVYYLKDERAKTAEKKLIETQLLLRTQQGWEARDYVWNEEQTDADLNVAGDIKPITWITKDGHERQVDFVVASKNECKSCHWSADHITPIGITGGNLNRDGEYVTGKQNQLQHWVSAGLLRDFTTTGAPKFPDWHDTLVTTEQRVRTYLSINCAHCHNPNGPAYISGLFLDWDGNSKALNGICKSPPSAGKGSCNLKYDIVPGKPGESIIVCRMAANELGIKMPQLGRTVIDNDGVSLIIQWISQLKGDCSVK